MPLHKIRNEDLDYIPQASTLPGPAVGETPEFLFHCWYAAAVMCKGVPTTGRKAKDNTSSGAKFSIDHSPLTIEF